jgi:hypothetical protein
VAIVQVSRITNRKGLVENLPQLAGAELGWAIDERRLFIGNGTLQEGAPTVGNTEILTEFSDILAEQSNYTYKGLAAGYQAVTGPNNTNITLSLQDWLDQFASVKDFGAVGDGVTDDTEAINRALFQLYCREVNTQSRRALFFPAGIYRVSETILIPSFARLYGEGANNSRIVLDTTSDDSSLFPYVARYADSLQQTGLNIGNNGAIPPNNIEIANMSFVSLMPTADVFLVENASFCTFSDVNFSGSFLITDLVENPEVVAAANTSAIRFASTPALTTNNITFRRCQFARATNAFTNTANIRGVLVTESDFRVLYRGIVLANPGALNSGAAGFRILGNSFDRIYQEGIQVQLNQQLVVSGYNIFYDVGNAVSTPKTPSTPVIDFSDSNNVSIGDLFERTDAEAEIRPRIRIGNNVNIAVTNGKKIQMGAYTRESGIRAILEGDAVDEALFTVDSLDIPAFKLEYTITRSAGDSSALTDIRTGTLTVVASIDGQGTNLVANDDFFENNNPGFSLGATETNGIITVNYTDNFSDPSTIQLPGTIKYSISYLA